MQADNFQNLQSLRFLETQESQRYSSCLRPRKCPCFSLKLKAGETQCPSLNTIRQEFLRTARSSFLFLSYFQLIGWDSLTLEEGVYSVSSRKALPDTPTVMFDQMSRHPTVLVSWHVNECQECQGHLGLSNDLPNVKRIWKLLQFCLLNHVKYGLWPMLILKYSVKGILGSVVPVKWPRYKSVIKGVIRPKSRKHHTTGSMERGGEWISSSSSGGSGEDGITWQDIWAKWLLSFFLI